MESILEIIGIFTQAISYFVGIAAVIVIMIGVVQTIWLYIFQHKKVYFGKLRLILNTHLILGLDLFIGKDIIDTFLAHATTLNWQDLLTLVTTIGVRIVLSYFLNKEIEQIKHKETKEVLEN